MSIATSTEVNVKAAGPGPPAPNGLRTRVVKVNNTQATLERGKPQSGSRRILSVALSIKHGTTEGGKSADIKPEGVAWLNSIFETSSPS
jgi:hypothetical protein